MRVYRSMYLVVAMALVTAGFGYGQPVDLLEALQQGQVWAQFRGWGDNAVRGTIGRSAYGPQQLSISPGTQFQAQQRSTQGMMTLGQTQVDLRGRSIAQVTLATACTNLGWRTPTAADVMMPVRDPDSRLVRLAEAIGRRHPPQPAAQLAVWAVANNPPRGRVTHFLDSVVRTAQAPELERHRLLTVAANLVRAAQLDPAKFAMFR